MDDVLEMLHLYRRARTRLATGRGDEEDRATALALGPLLGEDPPWHGVDAATSRRARTHAATIALPSGFVPAEVRALTGAGLLVSTSAQPSLGTRCVTRIDDDSGRRSYLLPSVVSMVEDAEFGTVALLFDGASDVMTRGPAWGGVPARRRSRGGFIA